MRLLHGSYMEIFMGERLLSMRFCSILILVRKMDFKLKSLKDSQLNGQSSFSKIGKKADSNMTMMSLLVP